MENVENQPKVKIIKRYQNRKLYDTECSKYVTLDAIARMIKDGEEVKVLDNKTKEDLTSVTLAQIIFEEEKKKKNILPLTLLKKLIQFPSESLMDIWKKGVSTGISSISHAKEEMEKYVGEIQKKIDERLSNAIESMGNLPKIQNQFSNFAKRIEELERKLKEMLGRGKSE